MTTTTKETTMTMNSTMLHVQMTGQYDDLDWERDAETDGGIVSTRALDGGEARAIAERLENVGYCVSTAPDSDDRSRRWIYAVPPTGMDDD